MSAKHYSGPTDLVYQVNEETESVTFAERSKALYVAQLYDALSSPTWGEFRERMPRGGWEEFLKHVGSVDDNGDPVDKFPTGDVPVVEDYIQTGYPEWLANSAIAWFPKELIDKYGWLESSMASDDSLYLPADQLNEIVADLRKLGCKVAPSPVGLI